MTNRRTSGQPKSIETLLHPEATRKNIPTAEWQSLVEDQTKDPLRVAYERRNRDLDPQLVWRGKDEQDRGEDAKEKKSTMETYWVPGVNNLKAQGQWAFAEFTDVWAIQSDFAAKVEAEFNPVLAEAVDAE